MLYHRSTVTYLNKANFRVHIRVYHVKSKQLKTHTQNWPQPPVVVGIIDKQPPQNFCWWYFTTTTQYIRVMLILILLYYWHIYWPRKMKLFLRVGRKSAGPTLYFCEQVRREESAKTWEPLIIYFPPREYNYIYTFPIAEGIRFIIGLREIRVPYKKG